MTGAPKKPDQRPLPPKEPKPGGPKPGTGSPYGTPPGRGPGYKEPQAARSKLADPRDIIIAPVISEKSYGLIEDNAYTFIVHPDSNKTQIKIAIEQIFKVKVDSVNTLNRPGKRKRTRTGYGQRKSTKRAIVTLAVGEEPIDLFGARGR